jgi:ketosteroid isomerase-like protein
MRNLLALLALVLLGPAASALFAQNAAAAILMEADTAFDQDARIETGKDVLVGKAALRAFYSRMFAAREFHIHWWPVQAEISADGTLGFTFGRAAVSWRDEKGEVHRSESRYTTLWRRQKDGAYKVVFDMGG